MNSNSEKDYRRTSGLTGLTGGAMEKRRGGKKVKIDLRIYTKNG
jgi:hypothetical protein